MKLEKTEAIVLHTFPSRERDKLVVFLTPAHGKRKGWAYGARSMRSRFGASLEPLAKINVGFIEKETEEIVRIESVDLIRSLFDTQQTLTGSMAAAYLAETVDTFAQPDDPSELIYRLLDRCLEALAAGCPAALVVTYFEVWILRVTGIFPSLRNCALCGQGLSLPYRYDAASGGFVCPECSDARALMLPNDVSAVLLTLVRMPVEQFVASAPLPEQVFDLRSLARELRRSFLGHELKSHDLLQSVL